MRRFLDATSTSTASLDSSRQSSYADPHATGQSVPSTGSRFQQDHCRLPAHTYRQLEKPQNIVTETDLLSQSYRSLDHFAARSRHQQYGQQSKTKKQKTDDRWCGSGEQLEPKTESEVELEGDKEVSISSCEPLDVAQLASTSSVLASAVSSIDWLAPYSQAILSPTHVLCHARSSSSVANASATIATTSSESTNGNGSVTQAVFKTNPSCLSSGYKDPEHSSHHSRLPGPFSGVESLEGNFPIQANRYYYNATTNEIQSSSSSPYGCPSRPQSHHHTHRRHFQNTRHQIDLTDNKQLELLPPPSQSTTNNRHRFGVSADNLNVNNSLNESDVLNGSHTSLSIVGAPRDWNYSPRLNGHESGKTVENSASESLRTRANLPREKAQLRSRTVSRSGTSLQKSEDTDKNQSDSRQSLQTVAGKLSEQLQQCTSESSSKMAAKTGTEPTQYNPVQATRQGNPNPEGQVTVEISKKTREMRRKEIKKEFEKWDPGEKPGCRWTFVFDPSGRLCYYWSLVVSIAFLYNFWVIIYRFSFREINRETLAIWFTLDYLADFLYVLDICFHFRTGYLEEGVLQTDGEKLRNHYLNSTMFYIDALCLLPLDFLYLSIGFYSILRSFRLVKIYRFWAFLDRTERHTNYPNVFRAINLTHYVLVIFHWNACLAHIVSKTNGFGSEGWFRNSTCEKKDTACEYLHAFYWSTLALTTIGDLPRPRSKNEYIFLVIQMVLGLFLFAAVLGHVANIVTNVSTARKEFQAKLDAVKTYMRMRHVPDHLQNKVIRWFDYLWMTQKSSDEERSVGCLPDKLKAEIAIHVHLDTLKRVEIFQNTEAGFLCELVLRLRPVLFSPGDYICRKGEVGKEMYIVNRGKLQVVADDGKTVLATLRAGSYFGEISILNMGTAGNRRTASVRSVGYSDLFCLYKHDMWDVLKDYPAARVRLEAIAVKRLEKYKKEPIKKSRWLTPLSQAPYSQCHTLPHSTHLSHLTHFPHSTYSTYYAATHGGMTTGTATGYNDGLPHSPSLTSNYPYARMNPLERAARSRVYASEAGLAEELLELEKVAMGRSRSTPGLLESRGKKTLEDTPVRDDGNTPKPRSAKSPSTCSSPSGQRDCRARSCLDQRDSSLGTCCSRKQHNPTHKYAGPMSLSANPSQLTFLNPSPDFSNLSAHSPQVYHSTPSQSQTQNQLQSATQQQAVSQCVLAGTLQSQIPSSHQANQQTGQQALSCISTLHSHSHTQLAPSQSQCQSPQPMPPFLNLPATPHATGTSYTFQGPHAFIPIPTGTPVLASRSSPLNDYTNISPVSSSDTVHTVAPPTALYGTSPGNSSTATGTHLLVPSPIQITGMQSGMHSPLMSYGATGQRDQEALLNEIKRLRERLVTLETENATMSLKLSQSTWQVENRLAEIEMHISTNNQHQHQLSTPHELHPKHTGECQTDTDTASGSDDSDERNRESII